VTRASILRIAGSLLVAVGAYYIVGGLYLAVRYLAFPDTLPPGATLYVVGAPSQTAADVMASSNWTLVKSGVLALILGLIFALTGVRLRRRASSANAGA
jgi:hypothetical protein